MQAPPGMLIIVPSCVECNAIAGALVHLTLKERREYIQQHLCKKYKKLLAAPDWSDAEISSLRGRLRESVLCSQEAKRRVQLRIRYDG